MLDQVNRLLDEDEDQIGSESDSWDQDEDVEVFDEPIQKKTKLNIHKIISLTLRNENYVKIMMALYVHRRLTSSQLKRIAVPDCSLGTLRNILSRMHERGVVHRERINHLSSNFGDAVQLHYHLSSLGLMIVANEILDVYYHKDEPTLPKMHYLYSDLVVRSQANHHYEMQEFLTHLIQQCLSEGIIFPHSEWRRWPFLEVDGRVAYRPDWLIFEPTHYFSYIQQKRDYKENPLHIPLKSRDEIDTQICSEHFIPLINLECDAKTATVDALKRKWINIVNVMSQIPKNLTVFTTMGRYDEQDRETVIPLDARHHAVRIRTVRRSLIESILDNLKNDELQVIQGDEFNAMTTSADYIKTMDLKSYVSIEDLRNGLRKCFGSDVQFVEEDHLKQLVDKGGLPCKLDIMFSVQRDGNREFYCVLIARKAWVNPIARVHALSNWKKSTHEDLNILVLYPSRNELEEEIWLNGILDAKYVTYEDIVQGKAVGYSFSINRRSKDGSLEEIAL